MPASDVATDDETSATVLSLGNGGLTLENAQVAVATLNPAKAFGPFRIREDKFRVNADGIAGDWQPLANLVRLPGAEGPEVPGHAGTGVQTVGGATCT